MRGLKGFRAVAVIIAVGLAAACGTDGGPTAILPTGSGLVEPPQSCATASLRAAAVPTVPASGCDSPVDQPAAANAR